MIRRRPAARLILALVLGIALSLVVSNSASAADPVPYPGADYCRAAGSHCYDRMLDHHSNIQSAQVRLISSWFSMLDQTEAPYQEPVIDRDSCRSFGYSACPWFMSSQLWLGNQDHWIEVGIRNGWESPAMHFDNGQPGCDCQAYFTYWEDGPGDSVSHTHLIANITPDNSSHLYQILRSGGSHQFNIVIDGRVVGVSTAGTVNSFNDSAIGSEVSADTTVQPLSYLNQTCQSQWAVQDTKGNWFGIGDPNRGQHGSDNKNKPNNTFFGGWDKTSQQFCIGKGGL